MTNEAIKSLINLTGNVVEFDPPVEYYDRFANDVIAVHRIYVSFDNVWVGYKYVNVLWEEAPDNLQELIIHKLKQTL